MKSSQYWDKSWSIIDGCTPCSPGCENCWSMTMNKRFGKWPEKVTPRYDRINIPLTVKKPTVFCVWNDLFHEDLPDDFITSAYMTIFTQQRHMFLVLTKRPERMSILTRLYKDFYTGVPAIETERNVWHGLTVCNQQEADAKIPQLLQVPGHKWLSIEPMLGEIDLQYWLPDYTARAMGRVLGVDVSCPTIEAVVVGCETGPHRRPCKLEWIQGIVDQCKAAGVPCFVKQVEVGGKIVHELEQFPECLRVRELPWRNNA